MPDRNRRKHARPINHREAAAKAPPIQHARAVRPKRPPGTGLDRSTEGLIAATRTRLGPAPAGALPDRRTAEAKRRG